jgi:hypothetical protein
MHSRIFQISKNPIDKVDYIEESNYWDHWFIGSIADYVNGDTDRESDIEWLKHCYNNEGLLFGVDEGGEYFIVEDKHKYFAKNFEAFQKALKELTDVTIDDFITGKYGMNMCNLKLAYDDELGFYVDGDDTGMETFDSCIRSSSNGTKFYIGSTIDYHF